MTEKFVNLPDDSTNTGKKMRTIENTINAVVVEQEPVMLTDQTGADLSANIANLNITLSALRDAIVGVGPKTLTDVVTAVQATQTVTGPLTDTQLRATAVPVSGPLTDTQLRASAVPVTNLTLPLPTGAATEATLLTRTKPADQQHVVIDTNPVPVSGTFYQATQPTTNANQDASFAAPNAVAPAQVQAVAGSDGVILRPFPVTAAGLRIESGDPIHLELQKISAGIQLLVGALVGNIALEDVV